MLKSLTGAALAATLALALALTATASPAAAAAKTAKPATPAEPSPADDTALRSTVRCLVIGFSLIQQPDAEKQKFGTIISMYYFGKVDGLAPRADLETLIVEESAKMVGDVAQEEAKRCGLDLTQRGTALTQIGQHIQKRQAEAAQNAAAAAPAGEAPSPTTPPPAAPPDAAPPDTPK